MTCDQVDQKGQDWEQWIEVSKVCGTYLSTTEPEDIGLVADTDADPDTP